MPYSTLQRIQRAGETINERDLGRFGSRIAGRAFKEQNDPQRAYMWEVSILSDRNPLDNISLYAREVAIPESSNDPIVKEFMGQQFQYAGKESTSKQVTVTFWDDESLQIYAYFRNWLNWLQTPMQGGQAYKYNYMKDFQIRTKDHSDLFMSGQFYFKNCFPVNIGEVSLSYESNEIMTVPITLAYDTQIVSRGA